jgi:predicted heme/steroid binding protein
VPSKTGILFLHKLYGQEPTVEQEFTERQLRNYNGERGYRMYIAHAGVVYDVTDCPKWRRGLHENQHWPGQDLTDALGDAPHTASVFAHPCCKRVGILR